MISDGVERRASLPADAWARIRRLGISAGFTLDGAVSCDGSFDPGTLLEVPVSLTHNSMAGPPAPLEILAAAAEGAAQTLGVGDWLPSVTLDAAARCGARSILGSLEVGKYADFGFLSSDPRATDIRNFSQIECVATWIGGREIRL